MKKLLILATLITSLTFSSAHGEDVSLMQDARNPLADMIALPIQTELYLGVGPDDEKVSVTTFQPVYPINLGEDWNIITRTLVPLIYVPESEEGLNVLPQGVGGDTEFGVGDINFSGFISPSNTGKYIWGVGGSISVPSATDELLGSEKWSAGPSAVVLTQEGSWNKGLLVRQLNSFAGEDDRADVNQTLIQPWLYYSLNEEWYVFTEPVITADWEQDEDQRWVLPVGGGFGRAFYMGEQAVDVALSYYHHADKPDNGPEDVVRFSVQFLWPK